MFDIGWTELLLIGVVALIVIGPKELPGALRSLGKGLATVRKMAGEFQGQFQEALKEAELDGLKKEVDDLRATAASLNPLNTIRNELSSIEQTVRDPLSFDPSPAEADFDGPDRPAPAQPAAPQGASTQTAAPQPAPTQPAPAQPTPATAQPNVAAKPPATIVNVPLPDPLPPLTEKDFTPALKAAVPGTGGQPA
jgi:sec-independent protein translocase protein TatB